MRPDRPRTNVKAGFNQMHLPFMSALRTLRRRSTFFEISKRTQRKLSHFNDQSSEPHINFTDSARELGS